jgi:hypothetical protein
VYRYFAKKKSSKSLILLEASTGIEPVYTDLQSAASPLRQLAASGVGGLSDCFVPCKGHPSGFGGKTTPLDIADARRI